MLHKFMAFPKILLFIIVIITSFLIQTEGADKYTDGNRPYEFGFKIDGEQHRKEKKDEKGLIMGEFGFITADGVYHVTVYATDEQGRFKILSMKNIRVKPYPTYTRPQIGSARQGHSLDLQTPQQSLSQGTPPASKSEIAYKNISIERPAKSCSSCSLPTTTTQAPATAFAQPNVQNTPSRSDTNSFGQNLASPKVGSSPSFPANQQSIYNNPQSYSPQSPGSLQNVPDLGLVSTKQNLPSNYPGPQSTQPQGSKPDALSETTKANTDKATGRTAKKYDGDVQQSFGTSRAQPNGISDQTTPNKPTLISAQMQIVDKNTDIYRRGPGEKEGLPNGLTKGDMTQLLYTFNYTVGFHGHFEEGYRNGAKQGYYYVTGRNGVRTRVDYVADEKGFRPKITQEVLDLLSEDVPKPETEKEEKYGLKGYEFKWLYYPVESNRR